MLGNIRKSLKKTNFKIINSITQNEDTYSWKEINCFFKPWAILFRSFNPEFFDLFLFYISYYDSFWADGWFEQQYEEFNTEPCITFFCFYDSILKEKFGLGFKNVEFLNAEEMHQKIKDKIDKGSRILVPGDLFHLNYYEDYKLKHHAHYFIIKGYDTEREIYYILDTVHIDGGSNAIYKNFVIDFSKLYELCKSYFVHYYPNLNKTYFWMLDEVEEKNDFTYINALNDNYKHFQKVNNGEATIKYLEYESVIKLLQFEPKQRYYFFEYIVSKLNFKRVYYDILFKYLSKLNSQNIKATTDLCNFKASLVDNWKFLRQKIIYDLTKGIENFEKFKISAESCIEKEKIFRDMFIEIIDTCNLEELIIQQKVERQNSGFTIKNNKCAKIIEEAEKIEIIHSDNTMYNLWVMHDDAPQVLKYLKGKCNFIIESKITTICKAERSFQSGIIVQLVDGTRFLFGNEEGQGIKILCPEYGEDCVLYVKSLPTNEIFLKVQKDENVYSFYYKVDKNDVWDRLYMFESSEQAKYLGFFSKTWEAIKHRTIFTDIIIK